MKSPLIAVVTLALAAASVAGPAQARSQARYARKDAAAAVPDGVVKPGRWEFAAQLQPSSTAPAAGQTGGGEQGQGGNGLAAIYQMCVDPNRAVPSDLGPNCKIDRLSRTGIQISWSMTCTNQQSTVHSDGAARYHGETMDATLVNHVPNPDGKLTDVIQRITGRYLEPCGQTAEAQAGSTAPSAAANEAAHSIEPPPATPSATPPAAGATAAGAGAAAATGAARVQQDRRYAAPRRSYRRHYRYYAAGPPNILALPFMAVRGLFGR